MDRDETRKNILDVIDAIDRDETRRYKQSETRLPQGNIRICRCAKRASNPPPA